MATRLTDKHPHQIKLEKLWKLMQDLDIQILPRGTRTLVYIDDETYDLEDRENGETIGEFPPAFEAMLVKGRG